MSADPLTTRPRAAGEHTGVGPSTRDTWQELESLVDELAALAKTDLTSHEFFSRLLDRTVRALAAVGGAVWLRRAEGWSLEYQINLAGVEDAPGKRSSDEQNARLAALAVGEVRMLAPRAGSGRESAALNATELLLLAGPLTADEEPFGLIEIYQRPGASPSAQRGYLQLLSVLCETAADFQRNRQLRDMRGLEALWDQFDRFAEVAHGHLDLDAAAFTIANEGRRLIECDRASVAVCRSKRPRLAAISGIDEFDKRSNVVRLLEQLTSAVLAAGEPLWYRGGEQDLPPQMERLLDAYLEETHVRLLAIVPLSPLPLESAAETRPLGALIVENFEQPAAEDALRKRVSVVARHAAGAVRNALEYRNIPFSFLLRPLGRMRWFVQLRQLPFTLLALMAVAAAITALAVAPADFKIEGRGELQPAVRRDVFAPSDGVVDELFVAHGDRVSRPVAEQADAGLLLKLRNLELEFEFSRVTGEKQTAETELASVQAARLSAVPSDPAAREQYNQLTGKEEELKELLKSLSAQLEVLRAQQAALSVYSPIEGEVLTWNVSQTLEARPVKRGQVLLTVAQTEGPWVLEMHVPDHHIGYVLAAQRELKPDLDVTFLLKTDPGATFEGKVLSVAKTTDDKSERAGTVLVTASVDREAIAELRPGATVVARIACGRRPIGYVWFHDLIETVRTRLLF